MLVKSVKETINEYNEQGALVKQTITETDEYDNSMIQVDAPYTQTNPWSPTQPNIMYTTVSNGKV